MTERINKKSKIVTEVNDSPPKTQEEEKPIEKAFNKARKEEAEKKKLTDPFEPPKKRKIELLDPLGIKSGKGPTKHTGFEDKKKKVCPDTQDVDIQKAMEPLIDRVDRLQASIERLQDILLQVEPDE